MDKDVNDFMQYLFWQKKKKKEIVLKLSSYRIDKLYVIPWVDNIFWCLVVKSLSVDALQN